MTFYERIKSKHISSLSLIGSPLAFLLRLFRGKAKYKSPQVNDVREITVMVTIVTVECKKGGIIDIRNQDNKWRDKCLDRVAVHRLKSIF